jgi:hypothetical protein
VRPGRWVRKISNTSGLSDNGKRQQTESDLIFPVPNQERSGSKKVAELEATDTGPLVSWLPDVPSQSYIRLQRYTKGCLEVMTMASPPLLKIGDQD